MIDNNDLKKYRWSRFPLCIFVVRLGFMSSWYAHDFTYNLNSFFSIITCVSTQRSDIKCMISVFVLPAPVIFHWPDEMRLLKTLVRHTKNQKPWLNFKDFHHAAVHRPVDICVEEWSINTFFFLFYIQCYSFWCASTNTNKILSFSIILF